MRCLLMFYFLLYIAFLYFCYRPLMGTSNLFHLASPQAPDTTMAWVHVARWGFLGFFLFCFAFLLLFFVCFFLFFLWHVLSLMKRPCLSSAFQHQRTKFSGAFMWTNSSKPRIRYILAERPTLEAPHPMPESGCSIPLQRQWEEWMLSCTEQEPFSFRSWYFTSLSCLHFLLVFRTSS